jgi:hypothetical protein
MQYYCLSTHPTIKKSIVGIAKELGYNTSSCGPQHDREYPYLLFDDKLNILSQTFSTDDRTAADVDGFIGLLEANKEIKLGGYKVEFLDKSIKVGCTVIPNEEVNEFIKKYNQYHNK